MKKFLLACFVLLLVFPAWSDDVAYLTFPGRDFSHGNTLGVPLLSFQVSNANTHSRTIRPHVTVTFLTEKEGLAKFCVRNGGVFKHVLISRYRQDPGGQPQWFETYQFRAVAIASVSYLGTKARVQFNFQTMAYKQKSAPTPSPISSAVKPSLSVQNQGRLAPSSTHSVVKPTPSATVFPSPPTSVPAPGLTPTFGH
jgi:hypothetical protein